MSGAEVDLSEQQSACKCSVRGLRGLRFCRCWEVDSCCCFCHLPRILWESFFFFLSTSSKSSSLEMSPLLDQVQVAWMPPATPNTSETSHGCPRSSEVSGLTSTQGDLRGEGVLDGHISRGSALRSDAVVTRGRTHESSAEAPRPSLFLASGLWREGGGSSWQAQVCPGVSHSSPHAVRPPGIRQALGEQVASHSSLSMPPPDTEQQRPRAPAPHGDHVPSAPHPRSLQTAASLPKQGCVGHSGPSCPAASRILSSADPAQLHEGLSPTWICIQASLSLLPAKWRGQHTCVSGLWRPGVHGRPGHVESVCRGEPGSLLFQAPEALARHDSWPPLSGMRRDEGDM